MLAPAVETNPSISQPEQGDFTTLPKQTFKSISIGIPCYNSAATIEKVLAGCFEFLPKVTSQDYEVFCLDDGSQDNTWEVLNQLKQKYPKLRLDRHQQNQGFGPTIGALLSNTRMEVNTLLPADGQTMPPALVPLLDQLSNYDLAIGHRKKRYDAFIRLLSSWVYNWLISIVAGKRVKDVNCAVAYRTQHMQGVKLKAQTAFVHAEFFLKMVKNGCRFIMVEIPHFARKDGKGGGGKPSVIWGTFKELLAYITGKL